jgi:hypothetical protein
MVAVVCWVILLQNQVFFNLCQRALQFLELNKSPASNPSPITASLENASRLRTPLG